MPNSLVEKSEFDTANEEIRARIAAGELDLREATCTPTLLGITNVSGYRFVPVSRLFPGDHQSAHRRRYQG